MSKANSVYSIVSKIPLGKVSTYGSIAHLVGTNPRVVGNILHKNSDPTSVPCHRIVHADGSLAKTFAFGGEDGQRKKLEAEGVIFNGDKVVRSYLI